MRSTAFEYHRPATLAEACQLGRTHHSVACFLAGGTELVVDLKQERVSVGHVISLRDIEGLDRIRVEDDFLRIGAMVKLADVAQSEEVAEHFPALREAVSAIGSIQIRNMGTIGGNFCGGVPCADSPPVCIAGEARLRIVGTDGEREVAAAEFFRSPREAVLDPGELLTEILIPVQPDDSGTSYQRFSLRRGSALAVASVAARIVLDEGVISDARVVLGAVAPVPLLAVECAGILIGERPVGDLFQQAAKVAAGEAKPITDIRGSRSFRKDLVQILALRALNEATARAGG
jgi:carbon-monoxide dehydrogenase medium subunit